MHEVHPTELTMRTKPDCALHVRIVFVLVVLVFCACPVKSFRTSAAKSSRDYLDTVRKPHRQSTEADDTPYERTYVFTKLVRTALQQHKRSSRNDVVTTQELRGKRLGVLGLDNLDFTATIFDKARKQNGRQTEGSRGLPRHRMLGSMFGGGEGGLQLPRGSTRLSSSASVDDVREMIRDLMNAGRRR